MSDAFDTLTSFGSALGNVLGDDSRDNVAILINGMKISDWVGVNIHMGIEIMPWSFELETTEFEPESGEIVVNEGDSCTVLIGAETVITGYIISVNRTFNAASHTITLTGASRSVDLTECSAKFDTYQINNTNPHSLAEKLCKPFGIDVGVEAGYEPVQIPQFSVVLTETPYEIIERICRYAALLVYDQPDGSILLARVGADTAGSGFIEGEHVESATYASSLNGRFSEIQTVVQGNNLLFNSPDEKNLQTQVDQLSIGQKVTDPGVTRYRPLLMMAEQGDLDYAVSKQRAQWEVNRRIARSKAVQVRVDSWRDEDGALWQPNTLAPVFLPTLKCTPEEPMIISEIVLSKSADEGTHADITLMPADAFVPEPINLAALAGNVAQALGEGNVSSDGQDKNSAESGGFY